jgi:hypothetical protein
LGNAGAVSLPKTEFIPVFGVTVRVIGAVEGTFPFWVIYNSKAADRKQHPETTFLFTCFIKRPSPTTSSFLTQSPTSIKGLRSFEQLHRELSIVSQQHRHHVYTKDHGFLDSQTQKRNA